MKKINISLLTVTSFLFVTCASEAQTVTGSGTYQYIPRWNTSPSGSTLTTSSIFDNGSVVNVVGTTGLTWGQGTTGLTTIGTNVTGGSLYVNTPGQTAWSSGLGIDGTYSVPSTTVNIKAYGTKYSGYGSNLTFSTTNATVLSEAMRIDKTGNVGIGTTTLLAKLHVYNGNVLFNGTTGAIPTTGSGTRMMWYPAKAAFRAGAVTGTAWDDANIGTSSVAFGTDTKAYGAYSTAFGGGTTATGNTSMAAGAYTNATGATSFAEGLYSTASGDYSTAFGTYTTAQPYGSFVVGQYNVISGTTSSWVAADPLFVVGNGSSSSVTSNAITVLKNGKTLIGNPALTSFAGTPDGYLLFVQTGILTEKVKVAVCTTSNWSDYVFDKKYKLKSIEELESFVNINKHLPNVPSAEEVVKDGIDMATMDAKLLEKIEELSLYIIQQNKRIEVLEKKNQ